MKQIKLTYKAMPHAAANLYAENLISKLKASNVFAPDGAGADLLFQGLEKAIEQLVGATGLQRGIIRTHQVTEAREELDRQLDMLLVQVQLRLTQQKLSKTEYISQLSELGLEVRTAKGRGKRVFSAEAGMEEGMMKLYAETGAKAYLWQYTDDLTNFSNRKELDITWVSQTEVSGLKHGATYAFFHRPIGPNASNKWEGPLVVTV